MAGIFVTIRLVRLQPVPARAHFHFQRHAAGQQQGRSHQLLYFGGDVGHLLGHGVEHEFVVYLQYHLGAELLLAQPVVNINHGHFDDVGGRALDGGVESIYGSC